MAVSYTHLGLTAAAPQPVSVVEGVAQIGGMLTDAQLTRHVFQIGHAGLLQNCLLYTSRCV